MQERCGAEGVCMAERRRKTVRKAGRGTRRRKNGGGRRFLFALLLFIAAAAAAVYFTSETPHERRGPVRPESAAESVLDTVRESAEEIFEETPREEKAAPEKKSAPEKKAAAEKRAPAKQEAAPAAALAEKETAKGPAPGSLRGRLAVCIDDGGRDLDSQRVYEQMGIPLTLAVMPNQPYTQEAAARWAAAGLPVIIHQPMESVSGAAAEKVLLLTTMDSAAQRQILADSFRQIPQAVGLNNHQGSKATTDRRTMDTVMAALAARGMFFFDSATNTTTAADAAAAAAGVPYVRNQLFVDNSADVEEIKAMIRKGARMAAANGSAVIIGHCRPHTAEAFRQAVPELRRAGIEFVYLSSLTH